MQKQSIAIEHRDYDRFAIDTLEMGQVSTSHFFHTFWYEIQIYIL